MINFTGGERMTQGYLALPPSGAGPGVLVLHAWWGLNDFFKQFCDRLAAAGIVALAPDLYDGRTAATIEEAQQLIATLDDERTTEAVVGAVNYLQGNAAVVGDTLGTVGFSMGGAWALLLATALAPEDLGAVVVFYGNYADIEQDDYAKSHAAFLGHFAETDEWEPVADVQQTEERMRAAGRPVTFHFYPGVGHWFSEADRSDAFNAEAAELAWQRTVDFLRAKLAPPA